MKKFKIIFYKQKFKITDQEKEAYYEWWWLPEPEVTTAEGLKSRLEKLRRQVKWLRKIADKYDHDFVHAKQWSLNNISNEITILN